MCRMVCLLYLHGRIPCNTPILPNTPSLPSQPPSPPHTQNTTYRNAVCTNNGPRNDPPIPIATTFVNGRPVTPRHSPERTLFVNSLMRSNTSHTSSTTLRPLSFMMASRGARRATCSTARSSVGLMCSPLNMALILSRSCARSASLYMSCGVFGGGWVGGWGGWGVMVMEMECVWPWVNCVGGIQHTHTHTVIPALFLEAPAGVSSRETSCYTLW